MFEYDLDYESINKQAKEYDIKTALVGVPAMFLGLFGLAFFFLNYPWIILILYLPLFMGILWLVSTAVSNYKKLLVLEEKVFAYKRYIHKNCKEGLVDD